jgi:tricorn protease
MKLSSIIAIAITLFYYSAFSQISGNLMQFPDVSATQVTFVYGDDVWIAPKTGGTASRLSSPSGAESSPRFSPNGQQIAYTANYHGNSDVYIINTSGGIPKRLTYHGMFDRVLGWTPDGKSVLFASSRESGRQRFNQLYTVSVNGGEPIKLSVPYGEYASFSPDGSKIAYTDRSRVHRNWKRYRGGTAPDITVFDLKTFASENITKNFANDELPMWHESGLYYMSDNGPNKRNNLWKYDFVSGSSTQLTNFKDFDISYPEIGPSEIIFEAGGKLYLYNLTNSSTSEIKITILSDQKELLAIQKDVSSFIQFADISPDGNRVIVQARGELFNLPATEGYVANISKSSGSAERKPAWSPDGKWIACWSDASGEYQLVLYDLEGYKEPRTVTSFSKGFNYSIFWSPDSTKIIYVDQSMSINCIDVKTGKVTQADKGKYMFEGALRNFKVSWSPDSRWAAYAHGIDNPATNAIFLYDTESNKVSQLTSGYYTDRNPVFSQDGKHLFFITNRTFQPVYSDLDNTFIYPNSSGIAVGTLTKAEKSLLTVKNDAVDMQKEDEGGEEKEEGKKDSKKKNKKKDKDEGKEDVKVAETKIEIEGFENRVELLDVAPGNIRNLSALKEKLLYMRIPNSGTGEDVKPSLDYYDFEDRDVKTVIDDISNYRVSADGKKVLVVNSDAKFAVLEPKKEQKIEKPVPTQNLVMNVVPSEEWKQIFNDVWRFERDYFYDPFMHGVDWDLMKERYGKLIDQASSRNDVNIILGDLIAELNASHTYTGGGDTEGSKNMNVGYLGADLRIENGRYRILNIITGAPWDVEERSPLVKPGIDIKNGDYILAINGTEVDPGKPISAALQGLANTPIQITVNDKAFFDGAKKIIIEPMGSESRLRHLAWIEQNRKRVDDATNGRVGYIYVRSTGLDGQNELIRQFYAQMNKEGLIIDERFNSGGQIPDRFIELLDRKPLAYWAVRDGEDWAWPPSGNFGAKVMLINGFSGSGGDAFPDYFKKRGLGPLIGTRTWGGLIGITGAPPLIDNGGITMPTFRMYDPNGEWFKEGHGVDADIEVFEDFQQLANGTDVQLEAGITEVMRMLNSSGVNKKPERPAYEVRN